MKKKIGIIWYGELDSTNSELQRHITDFDNLSVVAAESQTMGRGQRGNRWFSAPGENLTFSILVRFGEDGIAELPIKKQHVLNLLVPLSVASFLRKHGISSSVKWPNDIYVRNRKICGILIENSERNSLVHTSIIGIGLNVNQTLFPETANAVSMKQITGEELDLKTALEEFTAIFTAYLEKLGTQSFKEEYDSLLFRKDRRFPYEDYIRNVRFEGTIKGVAEDGRLKVEDGNGEIRLYGFKEIGYIL